MYSQAMYSCLEHVQFEIGLTTIEHVFFDGNKKLEIRLNGLLYWNLFTLKEVSWM